MSKFYRNLIVGIAILCLCCLGIHFYAQWSIKRFDESLPSLPTRDTTGPNLIDSQDSSYNTVKSDVETENPTDVHVQPMHDTLDVPSVSENDTLDALMESSAGDQHIADTEESPQELFYYGDYTAEEISRIREWIENLNAELAAEYPEIVELQHLTPDEIAARYPTEEDRRYLQELASEMLDFYTEEIKAFMVVLPESLREEIISKLYQQLTRNWGKEAADKAMASVTDFAH